MCSSDSDGKTQRKNEEGGDNRNELKKDKIEESFEVPRATDFIATHSDSKCSSVQLYVHTRNW